jgi:hypothetical protein
MRWPTSIRVFGNLAIALLIAVPAHAGSVVVRTGEVAPFEGLLLDGAAAQAAADLAREGQACKMDNETLKNLLTVHQEKLGELQKSADAYAKAVGIYEQNERVRDKLEERMAAQLARDERVMGQMERAVSTAVMAAERANTALEKAEDRIQSANTRSFWGTVISFVAGIFIGPAAAAFIR